MDERRRRLGSPPSSTHARIQCADSQSARGHREVSGILSNILPIAIELLVRSGVSSMGETYLES